MAITVAAAAHAEDPADGAAAAGSLKRKSQAAEPDALDALDDEEEDAVEAEADDVAAFESDDDFVFVVEDVDAGELLDDEPRLSLR